MLRLAVLAVVPLVAAGTVEDPDVTDPADADGGLDIVAGWVQFANETVVFRIRLAEAFPPEYACSMDSTLQQGTFHYASFYVRPVDSGGQDTARWERGAHVGASVLTQCLLPGPAPWEYEWFQAAGRGGVNHVGNETAAEGRIDDGVAVIEVPRDAFGEDASVFTQLYMRSFSGRSGSAGSYVEDLAPDVGHGRNVTLHLEPVPDDAPAATNGEPSTGPVDEKTPWPLWAILVFAWAAMVRRTR